MYRKSIMQLFIQNKIKKATNLNFIIEKANSFFMEITKEKQTLEK